MNLIFAKLFERYVKWNYPARFSITMYISVFYFFLAFLILLPTKTYIDHQIFNNEIHYEKSTILIMVFGLLTAIIFFVYIGYIKNNYIQKLSEKYKKRSVNKALLFFIVTFAPVILMVLAGIITVLLNGASILGNEINGYFE